ncbi:MAG TPA: hypothetical protein VHD90_05360 [Phototrophicaceae bacterium]|nr:hypothetical protein [Phototrophicaceae bacterium]
MIQILTKESLATQKPTAKSKPGFRLMEHLRFVEQSPNQTVVEFIGTGDFSAQWFDRQRYEVDAGRDQEPLLYPPIYNEVSDPSLPRNVSIYKLGPAGVIFDEVTDGGEVKFITVGQSNFTVPIKHYAVGLEYSKDLVVYNELWNLPIIERQAGAAFNALKNHIHLSPFLTASYSTPNQTSASAVGSTLAEKYLRTIEDAVTHASSDTTNPRRGPYALLVSSANLFTMERALMRVPQEGLAVQSSAIGRIQNIIAYDGWSGARGKKTVSYSGVTANTAYLINLGFKAQDHQSYEKQPLQSASADGDLSRFILENAVLDSYFGVYANPIASTEEVSLPTS